MHSEQNVLAIDSGTQSVRVILFDRRGRELAVGRHPHAPLLRPTPGAVEQDPEDLWSALVAASRACMSEAAAAGHAPPVAAGLTTQRKLLLPCDRDGEPLAPALHWLDRRTAPPARPGVIGKAIRLVSGDDGLATTLVNLSQANVLRRAHPRAHARATSLLTISGWLTLRLTGALRDAQGSIIGVYPFDVKSGSWRGSRALMDLTGYRADQLPELVPAGSELGRVTPAAAEATGLPAGLPLVAVGGDKQAEVLGSGVTPESGRIAEISMGTGTSLSLVRRRLHSSMSFRWLCNAAAQPGAYVHEYMVFRGFWTWSWYLEQFAEHKRLAARQQETSADELLSAEAAAVPPGAEGLLAIPRWYPTLEDRSERGAILGFAEHHTLAHAARAIVEGIVMDLRRGGEIMADGFRAAPERLRIGGGGARSAWAVQAVADVFDLPVQVPHTAELSALGAAINAAVAAGIHPDHETAAREMVHMERTVEPIPGNVALYAHLYREAFLPAMEALRPVYRALTPRT